MNVLKKIFKYIEPLWVGIDGKISVRQCLAIYFSYKLIENVDYVIQKWDQGRPLGDISTIILTLAGTIPLLLGITAWSNMTSKKIEADVYSPQNGTATKIQNVENINVVSDKKEPEDAK